MKYNILCITGVKVSWNGECFYHEGVQSVINRKSTLNGIVSDEEVEDKDSI